MRSRLFRFVAVPILAGLVIIVALASAITIGLRLSLPDEEGVIAAPGLRAAVQVDRDAAGVPTLTAANRPDLAFALGFVHGQERFFQMDLLRRASAGEVSELVGTPTLAFDRGRRLHRFRTRARTILAGFSTEERRLIETYTAGVNHGLGRLRTSPFEYWVLRAEAEPWQPEDTILVAFAMYIDLQEERGWTDRRRGLAFATLGPALARFLYPDGTIWDAPLDGSAAFVPPIPGPDEMPTRPTHNPLETVAPDTAPGSNAWGVSGRLTTSGGAMVANDMHLNLRMPNIWFRARLVMEGGERLDATGVTLPGVPTLLAGSNGRVAWGFTNSYVDTGDLVALEAVGEDPKAYRTLEGPRTLKTIEERICARGEACETLAVEESVFGPVIGRDSGGRRLAFQWIAHDPSAVRLAPLLDLERARTAAEALEAARHAGLPAQNIVAGDSEGHLGWTLAGPIPKRTGHDGRMPLSSADAGPSAGRLPAAEVPLVLDPEGGRIWTANQRLFGGEKLATLGFGGYAHSGRATQIRNALQARERFVEGDMLALQLDSGTPVLTRWHALMQEHVARRPDDSRFARIQKALAAPSSNAAIDSVSYRLVRTFRANLIREVYGALTAPILSTGLDPWEAARLVPPEGEDVVFRLLENRPVHLLPRGYSDWDALIAASIVRVAEAIDEKSGGDVSRFTWGAANQAEIRHPISQAIPALSHFLDAPKEALPGDLWSPRVAGAGLGASQRFSVTPGREETGLFHMPGGQSGHPLSPYYQAGHADWVAGRPTPFLPGPAMRRLTLKRQ